MSDSPQAPGAGGKRPPGAGPLAPGPLRPPTGSPLGYTGPIGPRPVPSVSAATPVEPTPSFVPKLRPPAEPTDLVPVSEGWEDDTIATGPEPTTNATAATGTPMPTPVAAATPNPPRVASSPGGTSHGLANAARGSLTPARRLDPTPPPGEVRVVDPARPSPARAVSPSSPQLAEGGISEATLQKILDDVRFATRKEIPRLVDAELQPLLTAQREVLTRLDRLEAMIRASQATADDALQRANHAGQAAQAVGAQQAAVSLHAPPPVVHAAVVAPVAPVAPAPVIHAPAPAPVVVVPSVPPPAYHGDPLGSMAPLRPMPVDVVPYTGGDIDIPNELTSGKGRGVKLMLVVAILVLGGFAAMVISSNMH